MLFSILIFLFAFVQASVYEGFPFNEQLPNVARVNEEYIFTMANSTYRSTDGEVTYLAENLPSWLSFDSGSRTFYGTPTSQDVETFEFTLTGYDSDNSLSNNFSMIVSNSSGLHLTSADVMFTEIARYGNTNGNDGLIVKPGERFNVSFNSDAFETYPSASRPIIAYYGRSQDRTSLPNWIDFDPDTLSFYGTAPSVTSEIAPSQGYSFSFIASDYYGFTGAAGDFRILVGAHELSTSLNETIKVNGTLGEEINETIPIFSDVYLDDVIISQANISSVDSDNLPDYLTLNQDNYTLEGKFPNSSTFDNFTIIVNDVYGNTVSLPYLFDAIDSVFTVSELKDVNATKEEYFQYQLLDSYFTNVNDTDVKVDFNSNWLNYDSLNRTFTGDTPSDFDSLKVSVTASSNFDTETKLFNIIGIKKPITSSSSSSSSSSASSTSSSRSSSTGSASSSSAAAEKGTSKNSGVNHKALAIGLGVGIPVFILAIAGILFCCCFYRKRKSSNNEEDVEEGIVTVPGAQGGANAADLSAMNVMKLEEKAKGVSDSHSVSSSITHVESDFSADSDYFDAPEKPVKSWRANDKSDIVDVSTAPNKDKAMRLSDGSMSTVNTEQLFSVRLVDDYSNRNSGDSNVLLSNASLGASGRNSLANIERLDSDGNIVERAGTPTERRKLSRSPSANLDVVVEENSRSLSDNTNDTTYHTTSTRGRPNGEESDYSINLLSKIDQTRNNSAHAESGSEDQESYDSVSYEFMTTKKNGEIKWLEASSEINLASKEEDSSVYRNSDKAFSAMSLNSVMSERAIGREKLKGSKISGTANKAKLVDFTRKSSLRESSYDPNFEFEGQTARIQDDDESL